MIPKLLHKVWIGNNPDPLTYCDDWCDVMPGYELKIWDNETIQPYARKLKALVGDLDGICIVQATDIMRLLILQDLGGVYLDHDYEIRKDFTELLDRPFVATHRWSQNHFSKPPKLKPHYTTRQLMLRPIGDIADIFATDDDYFIGGMIDVCWFATVPNGEVITGAVERIISDMRLPKEQRMTFWDWSTGGHCLTHSVLATGLQLHNLTDSDFETNEVAKVYHRKYLHPLHAEVNEDPYAIHHSAWHDGTTFRDNCGDDVLYNKHLRSFADWYEKFII